MKSILDYRAERSEYTKEVSHQFQNYSVLALKANTPGENKNNNDSNILVKIFDNLLSKLLKEHIINKEKITSLDGDYFLFVIDYNSIDLKKLAFYIEVNHPLGQFVDLDIYKDDISVSRRDLLLPSRKCFICNKDAHVCTRNQTHSLNDLLYTIHENIEMYITESLIVSVEEAIMTELNLFPKFGLVSKINSGCHTDMDYITFIKSKNTIMPFVRKFITEGTKEIEPYILQKIGLQAESAMFESTKSINTHKGLIFLLGIFLPPLVDSILNNGNLEVLSSKIKDISNTIIGDYYNLIENKEDKSNSDLIYLKHNIKGVREEAINGLPSLFLNRSTNSMDTLLYFMSVLDDTTIIHKTNIKTFWNVKKEIKSIISNGGYYNNIDLVNSLSKSYITNNISPGGSADMLVLSEIFNSYKYLI